MNITVKLSKAQQRAVKKMQKHGDKWLSSYELYESLPTLDALHNKGVIDRKAERGSGFFPRNCIKYKLIGVF